MVVFVVYVADDFNGREWSCGGVFATHEKAREFCSDLNIRNGSATTIESFEMKIPSDVSMFSAANVEMLKALNGTLSILQSGGLAYEEEKQALAAVCRAVFTICESLVLVNGPE